MSPNERKVDLSKRENIGAILGALGGAAGFAMLGGGAGCREDTWWDPSAPASADDGGTVIVPNAIYNANGTGAWRRIYSGALNVVWFGAMGTGANDLPWTTPTITMGQSPQGSLAFDLIVSRAQLPSLNALAFGHLQSAVPSAPTVGAVAMCDGVDWDPLLRKAGLPYVVFWDGAGWRQVSATISAA